MTTYRLSASLTDKDKAELLNYSPLQQQLLWNRNITTKVDADLFINPSYEDSLHDPFLLHDMQVAVSRIIKAIKNNEKITIFSDYDCDGIPGAVVLHDFFKSINYENFDNYIPHRHYEGFGFSVEAVEKIAKTETKLIITIDCGTSNIEAAQKASELGIDVIVTDHHEPETQLPMTTALVNPKLGSYPFTELCGAAVVYKLVQALIAKGDFNLVTGFEKWWLDMVGVATIADMVPLTGENRVLATYGLQVLRKSKRPGLQHLLRKQKADQRYLTEDDIGFTLAPRINAASRMDTPEDAFFMLATTDEGEAGARVDHIEQLNTERKTEVAKMTREVHKRMKELTEIPDVIVLGNPDWRPSLVGLTANKLAEEFLRPAFLWGKDGNGCIKGSCRSDGKVSVVALMNQISDSFIEHGGHHFSGGFSVYEKSIYSFPTLLNEAFVTLGESALIAEELLVDFKLVLDEINYDLIKQQQSLAPFGVGNQKPVYLIEGVTPKEVGLFGKGKEHTKLVFETTGLAKEAIAFFRLPESFTKTPEPSKPVSLLCHLEQSYFMGRLQTRLRIVDIV